MALDYRVDFFHFVKDHEKGVLRVIDKITSNFEKWCPFNHNENHTTDPGCYLTFRGIRELIEALEDYKILFVFLQIDPTENPRLDEIIERLKHPIFNQNLDVFKDNLNEIKRFISFYQKKFYEESNKFTCLESERLGQGIKCFKIHVYYAAIILAVTGIEARIHLLVRSKNKKLYESEVKDATIGKIINLRDPDQYKDPKYQKIKKLLKEIIPERHVPLIKLLNNYRIVSAHPKLEEVDYNITNSILSLAFAFLLDEKTSIPLKLKDNHGGAPPF